MSRSVWIRAGRNTARSIEAVVTARSEQADCRPGVRRATALHSAIAFSDVLMVKLPR